MRSRAAALALCFAVLAAGVLAQDTIPIPKKPVKRVTDRPKVLKPQTRTDLEEKLKKFGDETGNQVVVWIGSTLPAGVTIDEYANASFNLWGIGQKEKNNGVLLMIFVKSRKMRIETGDGIRDRLPDARAAEILAAMKPDLRANDYDTAVRTATDSIVAALTPPPPPAPQKIDIEAELAALKKPPPPPPRDTSFLEVAPMCLAVAALGVLFLIVIFKVLKAIFSGLASGLSSGGGGGGGGSSNHVTVTHNHYRRGWGWGRGRDTTTVVNRIVHHDSGGSSSSSSKSDDGGSGGGSGGGFSGGGSSSGGGASDSW